MAKERENHCNSSEFSLKKNAMETYSLFIPPLTKYFPSGKRKSITKSNGILLLVPLPLEKCFSLKKKLQWKRTFLSHVLLVRFHSNCFLLLKRIVSRFEGEQDVRLYCISCCRTYSFCAPVCTNRNNTLFVHVYVYVCVCVFMWLCVCLFVCGCT